MKKATLAVITSVFFITGCSAIAANNKPDQSTMMGKPNKMGDMMHHMKGMDANGDGVLSKDEFMKAHEAMFDSMKNKDGVVDMKNMPACCGNMMQGNMKQGGGMMQGGKMMEGCPMMQDKKGS